MPISYRRLFQFFQPGNLVFGSVSAAHADEEGGEGVVLVLDVDQVDLVLLDRETVATAPHPPTLLVTSPATFRGRHLAGGRARGRDSVVLWPVTLTFDLVGAVEDGRPPASLGVAASPSPLPARRGQAEEVEVVVRRGRSGLDGLADLDRGAHGRGGGRACGGSGRSGAAAAEGLRKEPGNTAGSEGHLLCLQRSNAD